jgi:hypothetical protein
MLRAFALASQWKRTELRQKRLMIAWFWASADPKNGQMLLRKDMRQGRVCRRMTPIRFTSSFAAGFRKVI